MKHICDDAAQVIRQYINDRRYVFVFNCEVARESWVLWCVKNLSSSTEAGLPPAASYCVDMQRFIAWDKFTQLCAPPSSDSYMSVDSTIRRMFAASVIAENATNPFLEGVVPVEYAKDARYLSSSIAKRLPALNIWKRLRDKAVASFAPISGIDTPEMRDYAKIYSRYVSFMEQNNLFETSWQPNNLDTATRYILFYPFILEDWVQYESVLSSHESITVVDLPPAFITARPKSYLYPNARMELRKAALHIRELLSRGEDAASIALTVPDLKQLRPYVERELRLYDIPFATHLAQPLSATGLGRMFSAIYNCYTTGFSLSSVRVLLLSCSVPWKRFDANGTIIDWTTELVRLGSQMRCLCHYTENGQNVDPWEKIFTNPNLETERGWYRALKSSVTSLVNAPSFARMRQVWFSKWRDRTHGLLDSNAFEEGSDRYDKDADAILSRCVTALYKLEQLEKRLGIKGIQHYEFFLEELNNTLYSPQQDAMGVNVYDYKVCAFAAYKHNILINASQANVTVSYRTLDFLPQATRVSILPAQRETTDVSKEFLSLYSRTQDAVISASSNGFAGFSTPHSYLSIIRNGRECDTRDDLDKRDFVRQEKEYFVNGECPPVICNRQINEIASYASHCKAHDAHYSLLPIQKDVLASLGVLSFGEYHSALSIDDKIKSGANGATPSGDDTQNEAAKAVSALGQNMDSGNVIKISPTAMNNFFPCARKWLLRNVLRLSDEETFDTDLMSDYSAGNILHKMLEIFCRGYMDSKEVIPTVVADGTFGEAEGSVLSQVQMAASEAAKAVYDNLHSLLSMPLVSRALELQRAGYVRRVMNFLHKVCQDDEIKKGAISKYFMGGKYVSLVEEEKELYQDAKYILHGRIDCILETETGDHIIVDYKSGTMPSIKDSTVSDDGKIVDFQMPMYVLLIDADCAQASFLHIKDGKDTSVVSPMRHPIDTYSDTTLRLKEYAAHFAKRVSNMDFCPKDSESGYDNFSVWENCPKCPFKSICRKTYSTRHIAQDIYHKVL